MSAEGMPFQPLLPSQKGSATYPIDVARFPELLCLSQDLLAHPIVNTETGAVLKLGNLHIPMSGREEGGFDHASYNSRQQVTALLSTHLSSSFKWRLESSSTTAPAGDATGIGAVSVYEVDKEGVRV